MRLLQIEPGVEQTDGVKRGIDEALERFAVFNGADDVVIEQSELD